MIKHDLPLKLRGAWPKMERDYRTAVAEMQTASIKGGESEALNDAYTAAVDAILLTPAETLPDIRLKIEVMREHEVEDGWWRSEEHTSELQSLMRISYAVFCLKKKKRR